MLGMRKWGIRQAPAVLKVTSNRGNVGLSQDRGASNTDPYIIHLNIALSMVVSLDFGGKRHVSNGQMYLLRSPA